MAHLLCHLWAGMVDLEPFTLHVGLLSSLRIREVCRECPIPWLLLLPKVMLGLFLPNLNPTTEGPLAVVSLVLIAQTSLRDKTVLPHRSTAVSLPPIRNFLMDNSEWMMARIPILIPHHMHANSL
jgi:hypothetical protein